MMAQPQETPVGVRLNADSQERPSGSTRIGGPGRPKHGGLDRRGGLWVPDRLVADIFGRAERSKFPEDPASAGENSSTPDQSKESKVDSVYRWRKRGRLTNHLAKALNIGGRTSCLGVGQWFRDHYGTEATVIWSKVLGSEWPEPEELVEGKFLSKDYMESCTEEEFCPIIIVGLEISGQRVVACPQLVALLASYSVLRQRSVSLLNSLRARALTWVKDNWVAWESALEFLPGSIAVAFRLSLNEQTALDLIGSGPFDALDHVSSLGNGILRRRKARPSFAEWLPGKFFDYDSYNMPST